MSLIGMLLWLILTLFWLALIGRFILDWSIVLAGPPAWGGVRAKAIGFFTKVTEPVLGPVRRLIPPLRVGGMAIDLAFILVFIAVGVLRNVAGSL